MLVNIFGGIVRCDLIADGILGAVTEVGVSVPVVVRLEGTNAELGLQRLAQSGLAIETAATLVDAANKVVDAAAATRAGRQVRELGQAGVQGRANAGDQS